MSEPVTAFPATSPGSQGPDTVKIDEHGGAAVVMIRGRIVAATAPLLRDALAWAVRCHQRVVVDLSRATQIDRTGLGVLIAAQDLATTRAVQLCLTAPSPLLLAALCDLRAEAMLTTVEPTACPQVAHRASFTLPRPANPVLRFDPV